MERIERSLGAHGEAIGNLPTSPFGEVVEVREAVSRLHETQGELAEQVIELAGLVRSLPMSEMVEALTIELPDYSPQFDAMRKGIGDAQSSALAGLAASNRRLSELSAMVQDSKTQLSVYESRIRDMEAREPEIVMPEPVERGPMDIKVVSRDENGDISEIRID